MPPKTQYVKIDFSCLMVLSEPTNDIPDRLGTWDIGDALFNALAEHVQKTAEKTPGREIHVVELSDGSTSVNLYSPRKPRPR